MFDKNPSFYTSDMQKEVKDFVNFLESELSKVEPINKRNHIEVRQEQEEGVGRFPAPIISKNATERTIDSPNGPISMRMFVPKGDIRGIYYHIHGGGWVLGTAHHQDPILEEISNQCGVVVASVDYRLAPEHPYPAPNDDCENAGLWVLEDLTKEFNTNKVLIGGESAGAHLAVTTILRLRDKHGYKGFVGANLLYGVYDLSGSPSAYLWGDRHLILSTPIMEWFTDHYVGKGDIRREPDVSPLYANLNDMPRAFFTVGTQDPLHDDTVFMYNRWHAAGNDARRKGSSVEIYEGATHGFERQPTQLAEASLARIRNFISDCLSD